MEGWARVSADAPRVCPQLSSTLMVVQDGKQGGLSGWAIPTTQKKKNILRKILAKELKKTSPSCVTQ